MAKKYLSLEEAAAQLGLSQDNLKKLRESGDIRGFADRGTWKFKVEDVENLARQRQADSDPEVPLIKDEAGEDGNFLLESDEFNLDRSMDSDSDVRLTGSSHELILMDESDIKLSPLDSDSDINLQGGKGKSDSDSDVKLVGGEGSDSDVKLVGDDSDSDVKLSGDDDDSDSDVKLVDGATVMDVNLKKDKKGKSEDLSLLNESDSDIQLIKSNPTSSVLDDDGDDDSGISLSGDSSLMLGDDSGISLEGSDDEDEGITLSMDVDSGISLDTGDSGISLESVGDSGISLEEDSFAGTVPMMDVMAGDSVPATQFEIPALQEDSAYELNLDDSADTGVLPVQSAADSGELDDAQFDVDDSAVDEVDSVEEFEMEGGDFEDEEQGVFDAADDDVFAGDEDDEFAPRSAARRLPFAEAEWGTPTVAALAFSALLMLVAGVVMMDLIKNTATAATPSPVTGPLLSALGGLFEP